MCTKSFMQIIVPVLI